MNDNQENNQHELPTKQRTVPTDETVQKGLRRLFESTGLTYNSMLLALLNHYNAYGDPDSTSEYIRMYKPGPRKRRTMKFDDATFERFRTLAKDLDVTSNVAFAVLLECYNRHPGPIKVEGAGLRVPCPIGSPCAPDAPSAGPVAIKHVAPTRLKEGMSIGPAPAATAPGPDGEKAALLQALIDEEGTKTSIYRKSTALLSAFVPDA